MQKGDREPLAIVLFGPPGVGKGAQAEILSRNKGLVHLSTGDLLREEIQAGTELGRRVKDAVANGGFADDATVLGIVMSRINRPEYQDGFVLDGFPRNLRQAEMLDDLLSEKGRKVSTALFISAPDDVLLKRLSGRMVCSKCGETYHQEARRPKVVGVCDRCKGPVVRRPDDDPKVQRGRLEAYRVQTAPLEEYYRRAEVLKKVNGNQTIDGVAAEIAKQLDGFRPSQEGKGHMLSKAMQDAINSQVKNELYSAYLYLSMSAYCEGINLPGFAHWMRIQFQEETSNALKLIAHVYDRGGKTVLQAIEQPPAEFKSPVDVFEKTLEHEKKVTATIHNLYGLAVKEADYAAQALLLWFVNEQVEEEKTAHQILEQIKMIPEKGGALLFIDKHLGSRAK